LGVGAHHPGFGVSFVGSVLVGTIGSSWCVVNACTRNFGCNIGIKCISNLWRDC
jgi:hypothetical protein